mmetsp:Transcript_164559/g.527862  ORF Transcript_164559/g.527862 Transcript_164559/m.527862 type:complete len:215 (+) Transcript_164559:741-1385(+)
MCCCSSLAEENGVAEVQHHNGRIGAGRLSGIPHAAASGLPIDAGGDPAGRVTAGAFDPCHAPVAVARSNGAHLVAAHLQADGRNLLRQLEWCHRVGHREQQRIGNDFGVAPALVCRHGSTADGQRSAWCLLGYCWLGTIAVDEAGRRHVGRVGGIVRQESGARVHTNVHVAPEHDSAVPVLARDGLRLQARPAPERNARHHERHARDRAESHRG